MLVISALRQGGGYTLRRLDHLFGVSRATLERWRRYFHAVFPSSRSWQRLRGRLLPAIAPQDLPWGLIERFLKPRGDPQTALVACLRALQWPVL
jgi:hypothetical protein